MDSLENYRQIIRSILTPYAQIAYANISVRNMTAFDSDSDQYAILSEGWDQQRHHHGCLIHVEIRNGKVWIQRDGTEDGVATELVEAGIAKSDIVLGFHEPSVRPHTGFAIA